MVQENANAASANNSAGGGKKRNRNRNKNKNKQPGQQQQQQQQQQPPQQQLQGNRSRSGSDEVAQAATIVQAPAVTRSPAPFASTPAPTNNKSAQHVSKALPDPKLRQSDLIKNLALDMGANGFPGFQFQWREAEKRFHESMAGKVPYPTKPPWFEVLFFPFLLKSSLSRFIYLTRL